MDNDNKRIFKNTVLLYVRMIFLLAVNIYTSRLVLFLLGVEDYGVYQVVGGIVLIFSIVNGALSAGSSRFITLELGRGNDISLKKTFNVSFECHLVLSVLILLLAETIGLWYVNSVLVVPNGRIFAVNLIYQLSIVSCILSITQVPYSADIIAHERMNIYAYVGIAEGLFKLTLVGVLFLFEGLDKLILFGILNCTWSVLLQFYYRWYCYRRFPESHLVFIMDKSLFKNMLGFSFWDIIGSFTVEGNRQGINLVINKFFGVVYNASYGLTSRVSSVFSQFVNNFMTAVNPQITKDFAKGEIDKMKCLVYNSSKLGFILYCLVGIPAFIESDYLLKQWLINVPDKTSLFLKLAIIIAFIRSFARPVVTAVHASGNIKQLNVYSGGFSIVIVIPCTIFVYKLGFPVESSYCVSIFSCFVCNYIELWCLQKEIAAYSIKEYISKVYFPCVLVAFFAFLLDYSVFHFMNSNFVRLVFISLINTIVICLCCCVFILTKDQRIKLENKIKEKMFDFKRSWHI